MSRLPSAIPVTLRPGAVADPSGLARAVRPWLADHPVMGPESGMRGLLLEVPGGSAGLDHVRRAVPPLAAAFAALANPDDGSADDLVYALAVNAYPPSDPDQFQLRPHTDRRWFGQQFGEALPRWTTVSFLDIPAGARGGELAVFAAGAADALADCPREHARRTVREQGGRLVAPQPGLACVVPGTCPHAVIGHAGGDPDARRLTLIVAAFDRAPGDPSAAGLLTPVPGLAVG